MASVSEEHTEHSESERLSSRTNTSNDSSGALNLRPEPTGSQTTTGPAAGHDLTEGAEEVGRLSLKKQLASLGVAGLVAYGMLNTLYYTAAFYLVWRYVAKVPRGLGVTATAAKCADVVAITWVGSQATKLPRIAGAVMLSPVIDAGLAVLQRVLRLKSRGAAAAVVIILCLSMAVISYGSTIVMWA